MKRLQIPRLNAGTSSPAYVSEWLDQKGAEGKVNIVNWEEYPHQPLVSFRMAYDSGHIYLKFQVVGEQIRAVETEPNGNVWEDSCCEFFCSFDEQGYYNLETNCIGTQLLGWGKKGDREHASPRVIGEIKKHSTLGSSPLEAQSEESNYHLTMIIPLAAFIGHNALKFERGMTFRANFYKCGDKTPRPHFLSWNPIDTPQPDFHQPGFFGEVELV